MTRETHLAEEFVVVRSRSARERMSCGGKLLELWKLRALCYRSNLRGKKPLHIAQKEEKKNFLTISVLSDDTYPGMRRMAERATVYYINTIRRGLIIV